MLSLVLINIFVYLDALEMQNNIWKFDFPCAIMVSRENGELNHPTLSGWRRAQKQEILHWDEADLGLNTSSVGLQASPTKVLSTTVPQSNKKVCWITDVITLSQIICNNINN